MKDYLLIDGSGKPVIFADNKDIVIYGDYEEAKDDKSRTDMGIAALTYSAKINNEQLVLISKLDDFESVFGSFKYDTSNEDVFQIQLKKFFQDNEFSKP